MHFEQLVSYILILRLYCTWLKHFGLSHNTIHCFWNPHWCFGTVIFTNQCYVKLFKYCIIYFKSMGVKQKWKWVETSDALVYITVVIKMEIRFTEWQIFHCSSYTLNQPIICSIVKEKNRILKCVWIGWKQAKEHKAKCN